MVQDSEDAQRDWMHRLRPGDIVLVSASVQVLPHAAFPCPNARAAASCFSLKMISRHFFCPITSLSSFLLLFRFSCSAARQSRARFQTPSGAAPSLFRLLPAPSPLISTAHNCFAACCHCSAIIRSTAATLSHCPLCPRAAASCSMTASRRAALSHEHARVAAACAAGCRVNTHFRVVLFSKQRQSGSLRLGGE